MQVDYKTDTQRKQISNNNFPRVHIEGNPIANSRPNKSDTITETTTKTLSFNYFALIEIIIGILLLVRVDEFTKRLRDYYASSIVVETSNLKQ